MILQNKHLEEALNDLSTAYDSVPGDDHDHEDHALALAIVDRALADALRTSPDLLVLMDPTDIEPLDPRLKAKAGRILFVRAQLLYELEQDDFAAHSARLACQAFRETLSFHFEDEDRYVANHLHQLMQRDVTEVAFRPDEVADSYEQLFDYYAGRELLDRAEDMLFHAIALRDDPIPLLRRGLAFYDDLQTRDTRYLQKKGLPRYEVNQARRELLAELEAHSR